MRPNINIEEVAVRRKTHVTKRSPTPEEASKNRRRWLKETEHDLLYNLEKALSFPEKADG